MNKNTVIELKKPEESFQDVLTELLHSGARKLIKQAVQAEFEEFMATYQDLKDDSGRQLVVKNGHLPGRKISTSIGEVEVMIPRCKDKQIGKGKNVRFNSNLVPPYLKRTKQLEEFLPLLYLKGISTGDFRETLCGLLGPEAKGLSANTIVRLKSKWIDDHDDWQVRDLSEKTYVYFWADGVYFKARMEEAKQCVLVVIGTLPDGTKELVALWDGYRESEQSWQELLLDLKRRGLETGPKLAIGDSALGFWNALSKVYGETKIQRCWMHKTGNILNKMPKGMRKKAKNHIQQIWMAETKKEAKKAFDYFIDPYSQKYPKATNCLAKDKKELLAFFDFPAEHWAHIRTTNPIESTFATIRQRTYKTKNCLSRDTMLAMVFKLTLSAQKRWRKLNGYKLLAEIIEGVNFVDGIKQEKRAA